jgi:aquaporin Z
MPATAVKWFAAQLLDEPVAAQARTGHWTDNAKQAFTQHWPEYMIEALYIGTFMISACAFSVLLEHPGSPVRASVMNADVRRFLAGLAMGTTAILLIYSPLGQRSGAHESRNHADVLPAGKSRTLGRNLVHALTICRRVTGGVAGFRGAGSGAGPSRGQFRDYHPGMRGEAIAFAGELFITFLLMTVILTVSNSRKFARYTGLAAGTMVMLSIMFEAPLSGMSMNPARSFASDLVGMQWQGLWIYFVAPVVGMLSAAEVFVRTRGLRSVIWPS